MKFVKDAKGRNNPVTSSVVASEDLDLGPIRLTVNPPVTIEASKERLPAGAEPFRPTHEARCLTIDNPGLIAARCGHRNPRIRRKFRMIERNSADKRRFAITLGHYKPVFRPSDKEVVSERKLPIFQ